MLSVHQPIGKRRADFVDEDKVLVELKAITEFSHAHWAQVLNYLRAYHLEVGLLLNFGTKSMMFSGSCCETLSGSRIRTDYRMTRMATDRC